jgi:hypothetical protein
MTPEQRVGKRAEQKRRWDRENRRACVVCGALVWQSERCVPCEHQFRAEKHEALLRNIEEMWNAGRSMKAIAGSLGRRASSSSIGQEIVELRKAGRIGYRYKAYEEKAA